MWVQRSGDDPRLGQADRLGVQLVRLIRLFERTSSQLGPGRRDGIDRSGYMLLARLVKGGPQRQRLLAEAVHSDPSTVSRQVAALIGHGLVERTVDPDDGRASLLAPTTAGVRLFEDYRRERSHHLDALLAHWPEHEVGRFVELLDRFNTDFETYRTALLAPSRDEHEGVR